MICDKKHRYVSLFTNLSTDQGGYGRHKCAGCAYEAGFSQGYMRNESFLMNLDMLPDSQAGEVRHKSPHEAFALGYLYGVQQSYKNYPSNNAFRK